MSSPCAFLLLTVFYSCGIMYNCQTGVREGSAMGGKADTCAQKSRLLISFWCRWGKRRTVQSCGEPWSPLQSSQLVMLLVVRHKDCGCLSVHYVTLLCIVLWLNFRFCAVKRLITCNNQYALWSRLPDVLASLMCATAWKKCQLRWRLWKWVQLHLRKTPKETAGL